MVGGVLNGEFCIVEHGIIVVTTFCEQVGAVGCAQEGAVGCCLGVATEGLRMPLGGISLTSGRY